MAPRKQSRRKASKARPIAKVRKWRQALNALRSTATYDDLAKLAGEPKPPKTLKSRVEISELVVAEKVFQWRGEHSDLHAEERHMRELMRVLQLGRDLEPVDVVQLADQLYLVEGHHRLAAYAALGMSTVPVKPFTGALEAAWLKSLDANVRDKLPLTREDKHDAAFTLVKHRVQRELGMTWAEIAERAGVSERVVYKMRRTLADALAKGRKEALDWSWREALGKAREETIDYDPGTEDFRNEQARKMADQIMAKVSINLTANPDITAIALRMISEELPRALLEEWEEEAVEVLIGQARDAGSEEAERALNEALGHLSSARRRNEPEF